MSVRSAGPTPTTIPSWPPIATTWPTAVYVESEGLFTIIELDRARLASEYNDRPKDRPFDTILVIRVQPFSIKWRSDPAQLRGKVGRNDILGPLETIQNARGASQAERNSFDLNLVTSAAAA